MGKSAGKWIKTVLFGKKYSKSNFSKTVTPDKKTTDKTPLEDLSQNHPVISDPYQSTGTDVETLEHEKITSGPHCDDITLSSASHEVDSKNNNGSVPASRADIIRQEQAASNVQAAFRGYLARRAFRALKGIIRLQALIRGHLVRRQAVATLRCMGAIVKFQALARGLKVGFGAKSLSEPAKLATNTFIRKLLVKLPTARPLSLQYDVAEPNSARSWLERWSVSRFWDPPVRTKKITKAKPQRKQSGPQIIEPEAGKSKKTIRKAPTAPNGENGNPTSETDRPKRNPVKLTSNQKELAQEQAQSELERVKRNLRKVSSSSSVQATGRSETENENPQPFESVEIVKKSSNPDVQDLEIAIYSEKHQDHPDGEIDEPDNLDDPVDVPNDNHPAVETPRSVENGGKIESVINLDDEQSGNENQKIKKRRSLPAKQELSEKISQNSPILPSYMAVTESAKAKLRLQGLLSSKIGDDGGEYGNNARRHSLPASTIGKLSSFSPKVQKHVQANGKGVGKTNIGLMFSRDDKVAVQPGWRR